jgi:hypothetical protein
MVKVIVFVGWSLSLRPKILSTVFYKLRTAGKTGTSGNARRVFDFERARAILGFQPNPR